MALLSIYRSQSCRTGQADLCLFARFGIIVAEVIKIFIF